MGDLHLLDGHDLRRDLAENRGDAHAIPECVGAEARAAGNLVRVVGVVRVAELDAISLGHDRAEHAVEVRVLERAPSFQPLHLTM